MRGVPGTLFLLLATAIACGDDNSGSAPETERRVRSQPRDDGGTSSTRSGEQQDDDAGAPVDAGRQDASEPPDAAGILPDANTGADAATDANCVLVTLSYEAELVTIAGKPFGLEAGVDSGRMANGTMTYDTCVPDTDPLASPNTGEYDHASRETGVFTFALDAPSSGATVSLEISGSTRPLVGIRTLDYFDFDDGGHDVFRDVDRFMTVNGKLDEEAKVRFTIGAGPVDFSDDSLPEDFPYSGQSEADFACVQANEYCVTFSVAEATFGDSFLMVLHSLEQVP